jgi:hypothetical protein
MPSPEPLHQEAGPLTPSFANGADAGDLAWRQTRLRAITAVRAGDWPAAWQGFEQALSEHNCDDAFAVGLRADLSHTDWLSGHHPQALDGFASALTRAAALPAPDGAHLHAVIALVLAGLNQDMAGEARPDDERLLPGTCSDSAFWPEDPTPPELAWLQLLRLEERLGRSTLFAAHGQPIADAANPLVRWYFQQLAIRKLVRDDDPKKLIPHLIAAGRALRAGHESEEPALSTRADSPKPLSPEALATTVVPSLMASLVLQQGGTDLVTLLTGWQQEVAEPSPEAALRTWLTGALLIMHLTPDQAWELMRDPEQALDARLLAGLRALSGGLTLDRLYFTHCLVVLWAAQDAESLGSALLQTWFPDMMRQAWQLMGAAHPDLVAVPEIAETLLRVCLKPAPGWAGVRQILQSAQPAVHVSLGLPILDAFSTLIGPVPESAA